MLHVICHPRRGNVARYRVKSMCELRSWFPYSMNPGDERLSMPHNVREERQAGFESRIDSREDGIHVAGPDADKVLHRELMGNRSYQ